MAKFRESFHFQIRDIEIIETALRGELSRLSAHTLADSGDLSARSAAREINALLAKIYHQKVFYSQVRLTGVPGG
jgi:hypothetical protein